MEVFVFFLFWICFVLGFMTFDFLFIPIFVIYSCIITCKYFALKEKWNILNRNQQNPTGIQSNLEYGVFNEKNNEEIISYNINETSDENDFVIEENNLNTENEVVIDLVEKNVFNDNVSEVLVNNDENITIPLDEDVDKSTNYDAQRNLGVAFVILAAIIFATTTWNMMGSHLKVLSIFIVSVIFFVISNYFNKKRQLEKTSITFYNLGSIMIPVTILATASFEIFGDIFSIFNHSIYLVQTIMSITFAICTYKGHLLYKSDTFMKATSISNFVTVFMLMMFITSDFKFSLLGLLVYTSIYITYRIEKHGSDFYNVHAINNFAIILVLSSLITNINSLPLFISSSLLILFMLYTVSDKLIGRNYNNDISNIFYPLFIVISSLFESGFMLYSIIIVQAIICFVYLYKLKQGKEMPYIITSLIFVIIFRHFLTYGINYYTYIMYLITFFINYLIVTDKNGNHKIPSNLLFIAFTGIVYNHDIYLNLLLLFMLFITFVIQLKNKYCYILTVTIGNFIPVYILYLINYNYEINQLSYNILFIVLGIINYYLSVLIKEKIILKFFAAFLTYVGFLSIIISGLIGTLSFGSLFLIGLLGLLFNYFAVNDKDDFVTIVPNFVYTIIVLIFIYGHFSYINLLLLIVLSITYFIQNNKIYFVLTVLISNLIPIYMLQIFDHNYDVYYLSYNILYMVLSLINYYLSILFKDNNVFRVLGIMIAYINYMVLLSVMDMSLIYLFIIGILTLIFNYFTVLDKKTVMSALPNIVFTNLVLNYLSGVIEVNAFMYLLLLTSLAYMAIGRVCFKKLFIEEKNIQIDYISLVSVIFLLRAFNISDASNLFLFWLVFALYFINLFNRGNKLVNYISLIGAGISSYFVLETQSIIPVSDVLLLEYEQGSILAILMTIGYILKKKYDETIEDIIFLASIISTFTLMVNIFDKNILINLIILLTALVSVLLWSNSTENKKWQVFSIVSIVILLFFKTRLFWFSIPWWIYLLITGLTLIIVAANKENNTKK